jgi:hypothetical protein
MRKVWSGDAPDYAVVQVEAKHVQDHYETAATDSQHQSTFVVRVRRRPEYFVLECLTPDWVNHTGNGVRSHFTFLFAPFTLFRAPHSGRNATTSTAASKLEKANFGFGLMGLVELWDFDSNAPILPFLNPLLEVGVLSTTPSPDDFSYPVLSLVGGLALRTGIDTKPDAAVESSVKFLFLVERLHTFGQRRDDADPSWNLLFGFGADVGSFGN